MKRSLHDALMARSGGRCEYNDGVRCAAMTALQCHHRDPKGMGGTKRKYDKPEDWVVLCEYHHLRHRGGHVGRLDATHP